MKRVRIAGIAQAEIRKARAWYKDHGSGLGSRFIDSLDRTFETVSETPGIFPRVYLDVQRAFVRPFPYGVFFQEKKKFIRVWPLCI